MQAKLKPIKRDIVEIFGNITVGGLFIPSLGIIGTLEFNNVIPLLYFPKILFACEFTR